MKWTDEEYLAYLADQDAAGREDRIVAGGFEQEIDKGKQIEKEKIAINLLKLVVDIDVIMNATNLSVEDIENLRKKMS